MWLDKIRSYEWRWRGSRRQACEWGGGASAATDPLEEKELRKVPVQKQGEGSGSERARKKTKGRKKQRAPNAERPLGHPPWGAICGAVLRHRPPCVRRKNAVGARRWPLSTEMALGLESTVGGWVPASGWRPLPPTIPPPPLRGMGCLSRRQCLSPPIHIPSWGTGTGAGESTGWMPTGRRGLGGSGPPISAGNWRWVSPSPQRRRGLSHPDSGRGRIRLKDGKARWGLVLAHTSPLEVGAPPLPPRNKGGCCSILTPIPAIGMAAGEKNRERREGVRWARPPEGAEGRRGRRTNRSGAVAGQGGRRDGVLRDKRSKGTVTIEHERAGGEMTTQPTPERS